MDPLEVKIINNSLENGPIESNAHIAIGFDVLKSKTKLNNLTETIKPGGFILTSESNDVSENDIENNDLVLVSKLYADTNIFYLLRKVR